MFVTAAVAEQDLKPKNFSDGVKTPQSMGISLFAKPPNVTIEWKVYCINVSDGVVLWDKTVHSAKPKYPIHPSNTFATESPVADENGVAGQALRAAFGGDDGVADVVDASDGAGGDDGGGSGDA